MEKTGHRTLDNNAKRQLGDEGLTVRLVLIIITSAMA